MTTVADELCPVPPEKLVVEGVTRSHLYQRSITNATALNLGNIAVGVGRSWLLMEQTSAAGGRLAGDFFDMGVLAYADGRASESATEVIDCQFSGRLSDQGRNVLAFACAEGKVTAKIQNSSLRKCGQDGVCAVAAKVPATVDIRLEHSTVERAGQMNVEGTTLNFPPSDASRAAESLISIEVTDSTLRDAGAAGSFQSEAHNIWLAPTSLSPGPFARDRYMLTVRNSTLAKAHRTGIEIGNAGSEFKTTPDEGESRVTLHGNSIVDNGSFDLAIDAANVRVDARENWWGSPSGLATNRVQWFEQTSPSELDASSPLPRPPVR
jgi:hypothetical protein